MPHLVLHFTADREMEDKISPKGNIRTVPTGKETISFKIIDTDKGEVVEFSADATNVNLQERPPNHAEMHTASQVLGKEPGQNIAMKQFEAVSAERDSYRQKFMSSETQIATVNRANESLRSQVRRLEKNQIDQSAKKLLADALDEKIMQLAALQDFEGYEKAKKIYRQLTGHGWADDDSEDD